MIAGNWKMNGSRDSIKLLLQNLLQHREQYQHLEMTVFPPYVFLDLVEHYLRGSPIAWGAQNMSSEDSGAFTGEISVAMLKEFHCEYVIVGHSERRQLFGETDEQVAKKVTRALRHGLRPIVCVGETADQRKNGSTLAVIERQLAAVLKLADNLSDLAQALIAYEPVWAIGTGQNATPEQAQEVHAAIRAQLKAKDPDLAANMRIIYGGSVKPDNAGSLFAMADIDGALVGGASLQADQFIEIAKQCKR